MNNRFIEERHIQREVILLDTHTIFNPITAIKGYISLIQEGTFGKVPPKIKQILKHVEESTDTLISTVQEEVNKKFM